MIPAKFGQNLASNLGDNFLAIVLFGLMLNIPVNSYGHVGMVSSTKYT